jgi:chemotaxis protein CheD
LALITVAIADCRLSNSPDDVLVTYALGSCVGVAVYDPVACVGGLLHYMLPEAGLDPVKASANPFLFADTGIPQLFRRSYDLGADKRRLLVWLAGGGEVMDDAGVFHIGKCNAFAARKILWRAGVRSHGESFGGPVSRTLRLEMSTGRVWLRTEDARE